MSLDYDRYVISELFPVSVLDQDTGDSYPIADGIGFVEEMCRLLNKFNEENADLKEENKEFKAENEQLKQFLKKRCPMCRCNLELFYEDAKKLNELQLGVKNND